MCLLIMSTVRKSYSAAKKLEVIEAYQTTFAGNAVKTAEYFKIDRTLIKRWIQNKEKISQVRRSTKKIKVKSATHPKLEEKISEWISSQREKKLTVKRYKIANMARRLARNVDECINDPNFKDFKFSEGWLRLYMKRKNLCNRAITHKAQENKLKDEESIEIITDFLNSCRHVSNNYEPQFFFNIDSFIYGYASHVITFYKNTRKAYSSYFYKVIS